MFGYITTDREQLTEAQRREYRGYYCGLCRVLGQKYGAAGKTALSFDMTFLHLLLSSLYEPSLRQASHRCAVHPLQKQTGFYSEITDYCADMTVLLAYYNALDDWKDDKKLHKKLYADSLARFIPDIAVRFPRQESAVREQMAAIDAIERSGDMSLDAVANRFGAMMAELFVMGEDNFAPHLRALGDNLGKFVYFMDAYEDAKKDARHKNYNPLLPLRENADYKERCREILTMFLGGATAAFERLPLVENTQILRNILYAGVWTKYVLKEKK